MDISCRDSNGWTPLWWAVLGRKDDTVELLLGRGAEVDMESKAHISLATWMLGVEEKTVPCYAWEKLKLKVETRYILGDSIQLPSELTILF